MTLIIHPKVNELKERLTELIYEYEYLNTQVCPNIEREYVLKFGIYEYKLYELELDIKKLKRTIQLIKRQINHQNDIVLSEIEKKVDGEFEEYERQIQAQLEDIKHLESTEFEELSDEDAKKLKQTYRTLIKKLHPDLNPNQSLYNKMLFIRAVNLFKNANVKDLEALLLLVDDEAHHSDESEIEKLEKSIKNFEDKIAKIKQDYPYNKLELLENEEKGKEYMDMLLDLIKQRKEEIEKLNNIKDKLIENGEH